MRLWLPASLIKSSCKQISLVCFIFYVLLFQVKVHVGLAESNKCVETDENCVCVMDTLLRNIRTFLRFAEGINLTAKTKLWTCSEYMPLPKYLELNAGTQGHIWDDIDLQHDPHSPKLHYFKRKRRRSLPKNKLYFGSPTDQAFTDAMATLDPNAFHQYAIFGSSVTFRCAGSNPDALSTDQNQISWSYLNGDSLPAKATISESGNLVIPDLGLGDVDMYTCLVGPSDGDEVSSSWQTYTHQLSLVTEPVLILELTAAYATISCHSEVRRLLETQFPVWTETYISKYVTIHRLVVLCGQWKPTNDLEDSEGKGQRAYIIHSRVSALGMEIDVHATSNRKFCDTIECLELVQTKAVQTIRDSFIRILKLPIEVSDAHGQKVTWNLISDSLEMELILGCLPGFGLQYKLCFPCDPGYFSHKITMGGETCQPCPSDTYQPQPASESCLPCPRNLTNYRIGSTAIQHCELEGFLESIAAAAHIGEVSENGWLLVGLGGTGGLLIIITLVSISCCCPHTECGKCVRRICCCARSDDNEYDENESQELIGSNHRSRKRGKLRNN